MRFFSLFVLLLISHQAWCTIPLADLTITPESQTALDEPLADWSSSDFIEISPEQIAQAASLNQLLAEQTGVQIRSLGGLGSYSSLALRGFSSQQLSVYLDDIRLNSAYGGGVDLSQIPLDSIASIRLYKGNVPLKYAPANLAGVLVIKTKHQGQNQWRLGLGSFAERQGGIYLHHQQQAQGRPLLQSLDLGHLDVQNNFRYTNNNLTPLNPRDDFENPRHNAQVEQNQLIYGIRWGEEHQRLGGQLRLFEKSQGLPSYNNHPQTKSRFDNQSLNLHLQYQQIYGLWHWVQHLNRSQDKDHYLDPLSHIGLGAQDNIYTNDKIEIREFLQWVGDDHLFSLQWSWGEEHYQNLEQLSHTSWQIQRQSHNLGGEWQGDWNEHWSTWLKLQCEAQEDRGLYVSLGEEPPSCLSAWGTVWQINSRQQWQLHQEHTQRFPAFWEIHGDRGWVLGNNHLKKETSQNTSISWQWQKGQDLVSLNAFAHHSDNLIVMVYNAQGVGRPQNLRSTQQLGLEAQGKITTPSGWFAQMHLTQIQGHIEQTPVRQIPQLPSLKGLFKIGKTHQAWWFYGAFSWDSGHYLDTQNLLFIDAKHQLDAGLRYRLGALDSKFDFLNITNQAQTTASGAPLPGIHARAQIQWNF